MGLKTFFEPKSIAIVGASRHPRKIGNVILRNFLELKYSGNLYVVNPNAEEVLGQKTYNSIKEVPEPVELAIIATPSEKIFSLLEDCSSKKIKEIIVIGAGFSDSGNVKQEEKLKELIKKKKLNVLGPNCLGIYDSYSGIDTLFFPREKLDRPKKGAISLVCQSGSIGAIMIDKMAQENCGIRRFISYGTIGLDESDFIELLGKDDHTKVICLYIENLKDGRKFLDACKRVSKKKPIVAIKTGLPKTKEIKNIYKGAFKQARILQAETLDELFDYARILEKGKRASGNKMQVITNGGGIATRILDELDKVGLKLAELGKQTIEHLHREMPSFVNISNPLNLVADANDERFKIAIESSLQDKGVDALIVSLMPQSPAITINIIKLMKGLYESTEKPMYLVVPGGSFADTIKREFEEHLPSFSSPANAVKAIKALEKYYSSFYVEKPKAKSKTSQK